MKFKEYLTENKHPDFTIQFYGGSLVKLLGDILSYDKQLLTAFKKFALEEEIDGNTFKKFFEMQPNKANINCEWSIINIVGEFISRENAVALYFSNVEDTIWNGSSYRFATGLIRVNNNCYKIKKASFDMASQYNFEQMLSGVGAVGLMTRKEFNAHDFYTSVNHIGYEKTKNIKHPNGSHVYGVLHNWILFV